MKENYNDGFSIRCGKDSDGLEKLEQLCKEEAYKLIEEINMPENTTIEIVFWTDECFSELICVGHFKKDGSENITYEFDYSESTL